MELVKYNGQRTSLVPSARASQGEGIQVSQLINPPDKVVVKVLYLLYLHLYLLLSQ